MARTEDTAATTVDGAEGSWRNRALERSLKSARAKATSRSDRIIEAAMEIMQETGRTDFTIQELVDRSRTSLRSFYQYFSGKDELLLALLEETVAHSVRGLRTEIEGMAAFDGLEILVSHIYGGGKGSAHPRDGLHRAFSSHHVGFAETHSADYRRAFEPLAGLARELILRGQEEGSLREDLSPEGATRVFLQAVVGSALNNALGAGDPEARADAEVLWEFCRSGLTVGAVQKPARANLETTSEGWSS